MSNQFKSFNLIDYTKSKQTEIYEKYLPSAMKQLEKAILEAVNKGHSKIGIPTTGTLNAHHHELHSTINCIQKVLRLKPDEFSQLVRDVYQLSTENVYIEELNIFNHKYLVINWSETNAE
ncbi:hypothetical protein BHU61_06555 [Macrococcus epidermidis]|uniref:Uncharacterized protein n=1 Tax=Macrococcus epidermidis TaxID=1902580 RepID=A0A327ZRW3_9STAP|nr:hypothetical protein [Macrococcus epidermidis]RAK44969.1 hypothetical protein BHU61_06555 [Macrococcus epidermidis]